MDAYGTMVALGFEYLVCSSFPHKMEILMNDINLFTMPALTREPSKQALWGAEGMEEDEEVDVAENSAQVSRRPARQPWPPPACCAYVPPNQASADACCLRVGVLVCRWVRTWALWSTCTRPRTGSSPR